MTEFKTVTNIYTGELTDSYQVNAKEIELIKKLVTKDDVVMDIGANIGFMTTILAEQAKHVYAFEPSLDNFKQLCENTKHLDNVDRFETAVSDSNGSDKLYLCPQDPGMNRLYNSKWCKDGKQELVLTTKIDSLVYTFKDKKISFIKLDVEGYEYYVIKGAMKLLKRDHPTILLEFHPPSILESKSNPKDIYDMLKHDLGYNDPILVGENNEVMKSYDQLFEITNNCPALNILWKYNGQ